MPTKQPLRVVFMGTPDFAVPSLRALAARPDLATIVRVYTQPDRPAGRGQKVTEPPIKKTALELGLSVFQPESINQVDQKRELADCMADVVVVVAYAQFLGKAVLHIPRLGCVNVHSSLLPKYRGAAPIQYAIWKGEKQTGVTTMKLVSKMDAGPILLQRAIDIDQNMVAHELHDRLASIGGELLVETLELMRESKLEEKIQDESQVTYAHLIKKEDGLIHWESPGIEILRKMRAFDPWPGSFGRSSRGVLKVLKAKFHPEIVGAPDTSQPGDVFTQSGALWVRCSDGWIEIEQLQPEGKKPMTAQQFLNGLRDMELSFKKGLA